MYKYNSLYDLIEIEKILYRYSWYMNAYVSSYYYEIPYASLS